MAEPRASHAAGARGTPPPSHKNRPIPVQLKKKTYPNFYPEHEENVTRKCGPEDVGVQMMFNCQRRPSPSFGRGPSGGGAPCRRCPARLRVFLPLYMCFESVQASSPKLVLYGCIDGTQEVNILTNDGSILSVPAATRDAVINYAAPRQLTVHHECRKHFLFMATFARS